MKWIEPQYSKENVKQSGKILLSGDIYSPDFDEAFEVFFNWRAAHAFPMQIMLDFMRKNAIRIDKSALAVQRLKRIPSILEKLKREKNMSLSRMDDIAGCRVVLSNSEMVYRVYENLKRSRTSNICVRERDYIENPKNSGYRGIHLVYKYSGSKDIFHGLPVELQIRSKIQHSWATAVEVVGAFTKQALKASIGDADWLRFFQLAGIQFGKLEGYNGLTEQDFMEFARLTVKLEVFDRLKAFNVAIGKIAEKNTNGAGYYILLLDMERRQIHISRYNKSQLEEATRFYDSEEAKYRNDSTKDVVMVSGRSLIDIKVAYPNYFSDTHLFIENLYQVLSAN